LNEDEIQRMTCQRQIIMDELMKSKSHPTADQLFLNVREKLPRISLGTVYRNLEMLSKNGRVIKLDFGDGKMRFDGDTGDHYHIYCIHCGKVEDLPEYAVKKFEIDSSILKGYEITRRCVHLFGICNECNLKDKTEK
jgi:Fur family transcriptional regulator, ferric uptake regulator